jgi:PAS domain S-box-containing protein
MDSGNETVFLKIKNTEIKEVISYLDKSQIGYSLVNKSDSTINIENTCSIILQWNLSGEIIFANTFAENFYGFSDNDLKGRYISCLFPKSYDQDDMVHNILDHLDSKKNLIYTDKIKTKKSDGTIVWVLFTHKKLQEQKNDSFSICSTGYDITELIHSEYRCRLRESLLRDVYDNTPNIILRFNNRLKLLYVNTEWEKVTGVSRRDLIRNKKINSIMPKHFDALLKEIKEVRQCREVREIEFESSINHKKKTFQARIVPELNEIKEIYGILVIVNDISIIAEKTVQIADINEVLRKKNDELHNLNETLKKNDIAKSEFLSITSHELRGPLAGMIGLTQTLLAKDIEIDESEKEYYLEIIEKQCFRLSALLNDLLDITKVELGVMKLQKEKYDVLQLINDTLAIVQVPDGLMIKKSVPDHSICAYIDKNRIQQVLTNLLDNALQYTPDTGTVTLTVEPFSSYLRISIGDTGIGISKDDMAKIFNKFYRSKSPSKRIVKGSGLGLAISKNIVELHGGKIWVESEIGKGSCFYFTIPSGNLQKSC